MNSLLNNRQAPQNQLRPSNFREFAASMTPESAKMQIEDMLKNGQISQQQFEQAKSQVEQMRKLFR